ncbi:hypothetical protein HK104_010327 [Borealophlyctis nickersoniae]|nr:hypothetical protein HK104_010327 [Borealophlyctis nickersoniae]
MPLHKRRPVDIDPPPKEEDFPDPNQEVFQIRFTGEIFANYEDYFARYNLYRKRIFACAKSGKLNLTFEEALNSEREARRRVEEKFPDVWKKPAMEMIHYSVQKLNKLMDDLYDFFKDNIFANEFVYVDIEDETQTAKVLGPVETNGVSHGSAMDVDGSGGEPLFRVQLVDRDLELINPDDDGGQRVIFTLPATGLKRDRQVLSKQNFKKFIREVASKDVWVGAPWIIRPDLVRRYNLPTTPPPEVQELYEQRTRPKSHKKKEVVEEEEGAEPRKPNRRGKDKGPRKSRAPKVKLVFPMEDTEMHALAPPRTKLPSGDPVPDWPTPTYDFGEIPEELRTVLLQVYDFLVAFGKALNLHPFTLDDFMKALAHRHTAPKAVLMSEAFGVLIAVCCREWGKKIEAGGASGSSIPRTADSDSHYLETNPDAAAAADRCTEIYNSLPEEERAAVDQWWKWYPGRWATGYETQRGSYTNLLGGRTGAPHVGRLKAWEVALAGIVKDWISAERMPNKWRILARLLGGERDDHTAAVNGLAMEMDAMDVDVESQNGGTAPSSPFPETNGKSDQTPSDSPAEADESEDELVRTYPSRTKRRRTDDDGDWMPEGGEEPRGRRSRGGSRSNTATPSGTPPVSVRSRAQAKMTEAQNSVIDGLVAAAERGFWGLGTVDRLNMLSFMIEEGVSQSALIRDHVDESVEKATELRKERRMVLKERKDAAHARQELEKRDNEILGKEEEEEGEDGNEVATEASTPVGSSDSEQEANGGPRRRTERQKSRVQKLREEQSRREEQEQRRKQEYEQLRKGHKERQKEYRARAEERKKLEERENDLLRREVQIDLLLATLEGRSRIRPLGQDRFRNRYWFFDEALGVVTSEMIAAGVLYDGKGKPRGPKQYLGHLEWLCGRLFVEEVGEVGEEEVDGLEQLTNWLDVRGTRERDLKHALEQVSDLISAGMQKRNEDMLAALTRQESTPTRRRRMRRFGAGDADDEFVGEPYLDYTNRWAK